MIKQSLLFEQLINTANVIILNLDQDANIILINDYALTLTGYKREEVNGKNWFEIFIPDGNQQQIMQIFSDVWSGQDLHWGNENPILCKDRSRKIIS